ncbi:phosphate transporter PHO1 homolog 1-like [Selaginella moellendorffii]|uniref:phosphate transporter PHO1 homolog 1-like n=1 Tax=Selaginella moellendorffii TaxID=88036 RepID=UPI000D1D12DD|nr:phosphate transporter PHO1 homolog 1-like [Selaginella moellendorffii]|eukprot:XP_024540829.1 phosphate transporter PHO1 homolog 1-like [Selaginella moellendorffii]
MVKFQKQLEGQLVPEWRVKYCDYKQLKKVVKRIKNQILHTKNQQHKVFDPNVFSVVHKTRIADGEDFYETELFGTRSDHEKSFFFGLDDQHNKVDKFFRCKEDEYDAQAQQLHIQMQELIAMQELEGEPGNKGKVQRAAKMLQTAFVEFYRGLRLLRNFSYLKMVESSHFATSDKV